MHLSKPEGIQGADHGLGQIQLSIVMAQAVSSVCQSHIGQEFVTLRLFLPGEAWARPDV